MKLKAIIIENRNIDLMPVIENHAKHLPKGTPIEAITTLPIVNVHDYNRFLTDPRFWAEHCDVDRVLIFQHDSGLLRPGIERFFEFDYVGAPWGFQQWGGNGGLSLRNPKVMRDICERKPYQGMAVDGNEDVYFSNMIYHHFDNIYNLAHRSICSQFSVESIYQLGTFGWHAMDKYLTPAQCKTILNQYK